MVDEGEGRRVKVNSDGVDCRFKLHSPSKITLDMSTCKSDSKIKIELFYKYLKYLRSKISGSNIEK